MKSFVGCNRQHPFKSVFQQLLDFLPRLYIFDKGFHYRCQYYYSASLPSVALILHDLISHLFYVSTCFHKIFCFHRSICVSVASGSFSLLDLVVFLRRQYSAFDVIYSLQPLHHITVSFVSVMVYPVRVHESMNGFIFHANHHCIIRTNLCISLASEHIHNGTI